MKKRLLIALTAGVCAVVAAAPSSAAVISASATASGCLMNPDQNSEFRASGTAYATAYCTANTPFVTRDVSAGASSSFGKSGVSARYESTGQNAGLSSARAEVDDFLTVTTSSGGGILRFEIRIDGNLSIATGFSLNGQHGAKISYAFSANGTGHSYNSTLQWNGNFVSNPFSDTAMVDETLIVDVPFISGVGFNLASDFLATADCTTSVLSCVADSSFSSSATLLPTQVFDSGMNLLTDAVIVSDSAVGFVAEVVEPTALGLFGLGLAGLGLAARRRKTA